MIIWVLVILLAIAVGAFAVRRYANKAYQTALEDGRRGRAAADARAVRTGATVIGSIFAVLFFIALLFSTVVVVPETQAAVPVTFGKVGSTMSSGINIKAPWTNVHTFPTRPVTVELAGQEKVISRTADSGQVMTEIAVRWKVNKEQAPDLYRQVRTGNDDKISKDVVEKNTRQAVGEIYAHLTNLEATVGDRAATAQAIKDKLQEQLDRYGIIIEDVNLRSVEPDEQTAQVLGRLAQEKQNTETAKQQAKTAEEQANTQRIQAQAQADAAAILAQIPPEALDAQCVAIVREAVQKGTPLYVNPCGGSGAAGIIVNP